VFGLTGSELPEGIWNPFGERHLGARQNNRIAPYGILCSTPLTSLADYHVEACRLKEMSSEEQETAVELFKVFNEYCLEPNCGASSQAIHIHFRLHSFSCRILRIGFSL
jgi:hypothetical protein